MIVTETIPFIKSDKTREKVVLRSHLGGVVTVEIDVKTLEALGIEVLCEFRKTQEKSWLNLRMKKGHQHIFYAQRKFQEDQK